MRKVKFGSLSGAIQVYKYVFYKLYRFERLLLDPAPEYTALGLMLVLEGLNLALAVGVVRACVGIRQFPSFPKAGVISLLIVLAVPQYFCLIHRGKARKIIRCFANENRRQARIGAIVIASYVMLSFACFVTAGFLFGAR